MKVSEVMSNLENNTNLNMKEIDCHKLLHYYSELASTEQLVDHIEFCPKHTWLCLTD